MLTTLVFQLPPYEVGVAPDLMSKLDRVLETFEISPVQNVSTQMILVWLSLTLPSHAIIFRVSCLFLVAVSDFMRSFMHEFCSRFVCCISLRIHNVFVLMCHSGDIIILCCFVVFTVRQQR